MRSVAVKLRNICLDSGETTQYSLKGFRSACFHFSLLKVTAFIVNIFVVTAILFLVGLTATISINQDLIYLTTTFSFFILLLYFS